jgi:hypothetical protein
MKLTTNKLWQVANNGFYQETSYSTNELKQIRIANLHIDVILDLKVVGYGQN